MAREMPKLKILVVDDEADMRIFLCNLLGTCGYETIDAADGVEGDLGNSSSGPRVNTNPCP